MSAEQNRPTRAGSLALFFERVGRFEHRGQLGDVVRGLAEVLRELAPAALVLDHDADAGRTRIA